MTPPPDESPLCQTLVRLRSRAEAPPDGLFHEAVVTVGPVEIQETDRIQRGWAMKRGTVPR